MKKILLFTLLIGAACAGQINAAKDCYKDRPVTEAFLPNQSKMSFTSFFKWSTITSAIAKFKNAFTFSSKNTIQPKIPFMELAELKEKYEKATYASPEAALQGYEAILKNIPYKGVIVCHNIKKATNPYDCVTNPNDAIQSIYKIKLNHIAYTDYVKWIGGTQSKCYRDRMTNENSYRCDTNTY
jgi:hypothetical protein